MKRANMANGQTKKRTLSMMLELQFDFQPEGPNQTNQKKQQQPQNVLSSNLFMIRPLVKVEGHPEVTEFELLDLNQVWAMGPSTCSEVSKPLPDGQMPAWVTCTEEELVKVVVQPSWF
jgi:hypothetical protein